MYIRLKINNKSDNFTINNFSEHIIFESKVYTQSKYQIIPSLKIVEIKKKPSINYKKTKQNKTQKTKKKTKTATK